MLNEQVKTNSAIKQNVVIVEQKYYEFANELSSIENKDISGILSKEYVDSLDMRFYEVSELIDRIEKAFSKCQH